ncbi:MAG TPA: hypothetical protein VH542_02150 [Steroidobacteraceae bacterium]|jgi:hypothetical protein
MRTALITTVFTLLVLQSGGQIRGADQQPLVVQSRSVASVTEPAYCQRPATSDSFTAALRQDEGQLLLETGPGMSRADF